MRELARAAALGVVLLTAHLTTAFSANARVFDAESFTLDNGLRVVAVTNRTQPVVTHMLWYRVGAADEPPGLSGVAHYLEHIMFLGAQGDPDGQFSRIVQSEGGESNAFTGHDFTAYYQNIAVDRLPMIMAMEADRMTELAFDRRRVGNERNVIVEERRQVVDSSPAAQFAEQLSAALYQNHPYGIPVIGWEHEIASLTRRDAQDFYETWYAPNNAILVVSGDIDADELRPLVEETYGRIPPRSVPERIRPSEPGSLAERRVILEDARVGQPSWRRMYLAPTYSSEGREHVYALQVLSQIIGGGSTARLYRALVVEQNIATSAGSAYLDEALDPRFFAFFATPRDGVDLEAVEDAVDAEIERVLSEGVTEDEVRRARERLVTSAIFARDSVFGPARAIGAALSTGQTLDELQSWPEMIEAVTVEDVQAAAAFVFDLRNAVTGLLLPAGASQ